VVCMDPAGIVRRYNRVESQMAGLSRDKVLGETFFLTTGVCMNNYLVAQRFEDEPVLDVTLDYVLTFRMRPTPVKLRLLKHLDGRFRYVLIQR
jgi:photoactive yellow protein